MCTTCPYIDPSTVLHAPKRDQRITRPFTCRSTNLVYAVTCTKCPKIYIGETERTLHDRFDEHKKDTEKKDPNKSVAVHFNLPGHGVEHMRVRGIWQMRSDTIDRKNMETHLIDLLGTYFPDGLNRRH